MTKNKKIKRVKPGLLYRVKTNWFYGYQSFYVSAYEVYFEKSCTEPLIRSFSIPNGALVLGMVQGKQEYESYYLNHQYQKILFDKQICFIDKELLRPPKYGKWPKEYLG